MLVELIILRRQCGLPDKSGDAFEIDYPYVIDSIQSAMANEKAVHPGVAVFIVAERGRRGRV